MCIPPEGKTGAYPIVTPAPTNTSPANVDNPETNNCLVDVSPATSKVEPG